MSNLALTNKKFLSPQYPNTGTVLKIGHNLIYTCHLNFSDLILDTFLHVVKAEDHEAACISSMGIPSVLGDISNTHAQLSGITVWFPLNFFDFLPLIIILYPNIATQRCVMAMNQQFNITSVFKSGAY